MNDLNEMMKLVETSAIGTSLNKLCASFTKYHPTTGKTKKLPRPKPYTIRYLLSNEEDDKSSCIGENIHEVNHNKDSNFTQIVHCLQEDCISWMINSSCMIGVILMNNYCFQ